MLVFSLLVVSPGQPGDWVTDRAGDGWDQKKASGLQPLRLRFQV